MPYKPHADPTDYNDAPYDPDRFARLQEEWISSWFPDLFRVAGEMVEERGLDKLSYEELVK